MFLIVCSCDNQTKELQNKIFELRDSIEVLKNKEIDLTRELDNYKQSPEIICANIEEFSKKEKTKELDSIKKQLKKYHPQSEYIGIIQALIDSVKEVRVQKAKAEEEKRLQAVNILLKDYDDIKGVTWYTSRKLSSSGNYFRIYIGRADNTLTWIRLGMQYYGVDWIFFDKAYLSYDGNTKEIIFDQYKDRQSDNAYGYVWEWLDIVADNSTIAFVRKMANGKVAKWRLSGKYSETRVLTDKEKEGLKEILLAYDILKKTQKFKD